MRAAPRSSLGQAMLAGAVVPASAAAPALAPWLWPVSPALALGLIVGTHLPLFYGTFVPNGQLFGPVRTGFAGAPDEVWLTIDDGPDRHDTPRILDALDAAGARATFFVRGDRARAFPGLVEETVRRGHAVGNHTFTHPQRVFWGMTPARIGAEMDRCNAVLREITGAVPRGFRAPVGLVNPFVHREAHRRGMSVIGWSARAFDAGRLPLAPEVVLARIERRLRPGGIALLHEGAGAAPGGAARNVERLLGWLRERGWRAVIPRDGA